ncbi:methyltransferase domain-containing protein [Thioalkalivibrio sp. ALE14]|nr:methyltransferase domain-containing protein [Thioalkalivibrio sp. ALE14]
MALSRIEQLHGTPAEQAAVRRYPDLLQLKPGHDVLDVGAGAGHVAHHLAARVTARGTVCALDRSAALLAHARQRNRRALGVQGDAGALPFPAGRFDRVFARWLLLHLPDPFAAIREMLRVTRSGGRVLVVETDWDSLCISPGDTDLVRRIVHANTDRQANAASGRRLTALFRQAGCRDVQVHAFVDHVSTGDPNWVAFLESRLDVARAAGIDARDLALWWEDVRRAIDAGEFFACVTRIAVAGALTESVSDQPGNTSS